LGDSIGESSLERNTLKVFNTCVSDTEKGIEECKAIAEDYANRKADVISDFFDAMEDEAEEIGSVLKRKEYELRKTGIYDAKDRVLGILEKFEA